MKPSSSYIAATSGVEQATIVFSSVSVAPSTASTLFSVTSANRSVGAVSNTGTTSDRKPTCTLSRSMAASRRSYAMGLRLVF